MKKNEIPLTSTVPAAAAYRSTGVSEFRLQDNRPDAVMQRQQQSLLQLPQPVQLMEMGNGGTLRGIMQFELTDEEMQLQLRVFQKKKELKEIKDRVLVLKQQEDLAKQNEKSSTVGNQKNILSMFNRGMVQQNLNKSLVSEQEIQEEVNKLNDLTKNHVEQLSDKLLQDISELEEQDTETVLKNIGSKSKENRSQAEHIFLRQEWLSLFQERSSVIGAQNTLLAELNKQMDAWSKEQKRIQALNPLDEKVKLPNTLDWIQLGKSGQEKVTKVLQLGVYLAKLNGPLGRLTSSFKELANSYTIIEQNYFGYRGIENNLRAVFAAMFPERKLILGNRQFITRIKKLPGELGKLQNDLDLLLKLVDVRQENYNTDLKSVDNKFLVEQINTIKDIESQKDNDKTTVVGENKWANKGLKKLKPNISYTTGAAGYLYETDSEGRISRAHTAKLTLSKVPREPHDQATHDKLQDDHAGHLLGDRFGGSPQLDNLVSQSANVNLVAFKRIENSWAKALTQGKDVTVDIMVRYPENSKTRRPESFVVKYTIGKELKIVKIDNK